jgi:hypothetical protein
MTVRDGPGQPVKGDPVIGNSQILGIGSGRHFHRITGVGGVYGGLDIAAGAYRNHCGRSVRGEEKQ